MAQRKAGEVDAYLSRPDTSFPIVLVYGPDPGLVSERADKVAALSGIDRNDPFSAVTIPADELERDVGRLFDEARTVSLFGGRRLVRVKGAGAGRNLAAAVADLAAAPPVDALVVIEAGDLKANAPLRAAAERGRAAMALPCYPDEGRSLDRLIDEELSAASLRIEAGARELLRSRLGANRLASRGEVAKLCLYALGSGTVTEADVEAIVGDVSAEVLDEAVDAAATGAVRALPEIAGRLLSGGTQPFQLQNALMRHFQGLQLMRAEHEERGASLAALVERRRPPFRRKPALEAALGTWDGAAIARALRRIESDILLARKEGVLAATIARRTLTDTAVEAARLRRRSAR